MNGPRLTLKDHIEAFVFALIETVACVAASCVIIGSLLWVVWRIAGVVVQFD